MEVLHFKQFVGKLMDIKCKMLNNLFMNLMIDQLSSNLATELMDNHEMVKAVVLTINYFFAKMLTRSKK